MDRSRRELLVAAGFGVAGAWVAPAIIGADVAAAGTSPPCTPTNLAPSGVASQSSTGFGGVASRGNDGNTNGNYGAGSVFHTNNQAGAWWQVVLPASSVITSVSLYNRTNCCLTRAQSVSVSIDGTPFGVVPGTTGNWVTATLPVDCEEGQTVRVTNGITSWFHLAEVQVFGCPP